MADNALCEYCDLDSGLNDLDPKSGGTFNDFFSPIWDIVLSFTSSLISILLDVVLYAFCGVAEGMLFIANKLSFPDLVNSLQDVVNALDPVIAYLIYRSSIPEALLIVGGGMSFYVIRKLVTLGNW